MMNLTAIDDPIKVYKPDDRLKSISPHSYPEF